MSKIVRHLAVLQHLIPRIHPVSLSILSSCSLLLCLPALAEDEKIVDVASAGFDLDTLKARGIDPKVAEYFQYAARFQPGTHRVTLWSNGSRKGLVDARFDEDGKLCATADVLRLAGLQIPGDLPKNLSNNLSEEDKYSTDILLACYDYRGAWPQTAINLEPAENKVEIVAPLEAFSAPEFTPDEFTSGGVAGLLNYNVNTFTTHSGISEQSSLMASTELGFNVSDWIFRSRQTYSSENRKWNHLAAYVQRTLVDQKMIFQAGQINAAQSMFPIGSINGVQLMPEQAFTESVGSGANVEGIARTQARVEVRQLGSLIYSTVVPSGPFKIDDLNILNSTADLLVSVIESDGQRRQFTVAANSFINGVGVARGLSVAVGKLDAYGDMDAPWLINANNGWAMNASTNLSAGVLASVPYQSLALGVDSNLLQHVSISSRLLLANDAKHQQRGAQLNFSMSTQLFANVGVSISGNRQSKDYQDMPSAMVQQSLQVVDKRWQSRDQYGLGVSWSKKSIGGLSLNYSCSTTFSGDKTQRVTASWSKSFKHASVSFNMEHDMSGAGGVGGRASSGNQYYLNLNIPLGQRSVNTYARQSSGETRVGAQVSESINDRLNYSLSADKGSDQSAGLNASVGWLPRYTQLGLNYGNYGGGNSSYSFSASGGAVIHREGVTLSPYAIQDTFGIVKVGGLTGVKLHTPNGSVWTDPWGNAVIPMLPAYQDATVDISTKSLPRNIDIQNGSQSIDAGRGSFTQFNFDVIKVRRVLLTTTLENGAALPKGTVILNAADEFVTAAGDDGIVFINGENLSSALHVELEDGQRCTLDFSLPENVDLRRLYETAKAVCRR